MTIATVQMIVPLVVPIFAIAMGKDLWVMSVMNVLEKLSTMNSVVVFKDFIQTAEVT